MGMKICGQGLPPQTMMIPQYYGLLYKPHYRLNHSDTFITYLSSQEVKLWGTCVQHGVEVVEVRELASEDVPNVFLEINNKQN